MVVPGAAAGTAGIIMEAGLLLGLLLLLLLPVGLLLPATISPAPPPISLSVYTSVVWGDPPTHSTLCGGREARR